METGAAIALGVGALVLLLLYRQQQATKALYAAAIAKKKSGDASASDYVTTGVLVAGLI